jgi:uncharacterized protein YaiE (UPF0345 family)
MKIHQEIIYVGICYDTTTLSGKSSLVCFGINFNGEDTIGIHISKVYTFSTFKKEVLLVLPHEYIPKSK